jgi:hypothetical protein
MNTCAAVYDAIQTVATQTWNEHLTLTIYQSIYPQHLWPQDLANLFMIKSWAFGLYRLFFGFSALVFLIPL